MCKKILSSALPEQTGKKVEKVDQSGDRTLDRAIQKSTLNHYPTEQSIPLYQYGSTSIAKTHSPKNTHKVHTITLDIHQLTSFDYGGALLSLSEPNIKNCSSRTEVKNGWFWTLLGCTYMFSTMLDTVVRSYTGIHAPVYSNQTPLVWVVPGHSGPPADTQTDLELHKVV